MKDQDKRKLAERKSRIEGRLDPCWQPETAAPVLRALNTTYEVSGRINAIPCGGIGLVHQFVESLGLADAINKSVQVLERHRPYHESDHVLNLSYNILAGGKCLDDIEQLRNNESYLEVLGCRRIPDPTTAGDFLRRFDEHHALQLMEGINKARLRAWRGLPRRQRRLALIDVDGTITPTSGECKEGMALSYKGTWGYAPLIVSLANTQEVLYVKNRPGNQVSHSGAVEYMDAAVDLVRAGRFDRVRLRGDTDFSLTTEFDRWTAEGIEFVFGIDAHPRFVAEADSLPESAWKPLERARRRVPASRRRRRRENHKRRVVKERGFKNLVLEEEHVTELSYRPARARGRYRMIVVRKHIRVEQGQLELYPEVRYFFYVTNVSKRALSTANVVREANARCNQENVIEQLKNGVHAMRMPSDSLVSNWVYLIAASLAWNIKAWLSIALRSLQADVSREIRRMEFRRFLRAIMLLPCQVVRGARRLTLRLLVYSPWIGVLIDGLELFKRRRLKPA